MGGPRGRHRERPRGQRRVDAAAGVIAVAKLPNRVEKIIKEIAAKLHDDDPEMDAFTNDAERAATALVVRSTIQSMVELDKRRKPIWGFRADNVDGLQTLSRKLKSAEKALRALPGPAIFMVFAPELDGLDESIPSNRMQQKVPMRAVGFAKSIALVRSRCDELVRTKPGQ